MGMVVCMTLVFVMSFMSRGRSSGIPVVCMTFVPVMFFMLHFMMLFMFLMGGIR